MTISLCMIVKNEAAVLERCLKSVAGLVDEIIIVDTGSTDATRTIASRYADRVLDFEWIDDFSAARNYAFDQATMDYQMWLDADDVLPADEREKFVALKESLRPEIDLVTMKYHTHLDPNGRPLYSSTRERLLKREMGYRWLDPIHECIPLTGSIFQSDIEIYHMKPQSDTISTRNLDIYESLERKQSVLTPRQQYYFARELKDHRLWAKAAYYFERFLDEGLGWAPDNIGACFNLGICYQALKQEHKLLPALLRSFQYDIPHAEICCEIGYYYKRRNQYERALGWFQTALNLTEPASLGFVMPDYRGYIPQIESCVCCYALGRYDEAKKHNEEAGRIKPDSAAVKQNRDFLARMSS